jgi:NADH-dependent peroxiredoxin subunit F
LGHLLCGILLLMTDTQYDLIIIGGGPAGCSAAVYAARKRLKTLLVLKEWGGQSTVSDDIQNWIGTPHISGIDLAKNLQKHVEEYKGDILDIRTGEFVSSVEKNGEVVMVTLENGNIFTAKALLITTGSDRRKLDIPGAETFEHKGITYCASCDGPIFSDQDVVVIGGGNAAFESAAQLLAYCSSVTLLNRGAEFRADSITIEKLLKDPKFKIIQNATPKEIHGETMVNAITYTDSETGTDTTLPTAGVFVEIGQIPATGFVKNTVETNSYGKIIIDPRTQKTSTKGIWAAGDCTDILYHQNNIASGDAVRALEDIYVTLKTQ